MKNSALFILSRFTKT